MDVMRMFIARTLTLVTCLSFTTCSDDASGPADAARADAVPDTLACVAASGSCASGQSCCGGLTCCTGVPIPPGQERCEQFCPMAFQMTPSR